MKILVITQRAKIKRKKIYGQICPFVGKLTPLRGIRRIGANSLFRFERARVKS